MKLEHLGIHKRLGFLIQHCGGYDRDYHMDVIAKRYNLTDNQINILFNVALASNRNHYLGLLEAGMGIEPIIELIYKDLSRYRIETSALMSAFYAVSASQVRIPTLMR